MLEVNHLSFAYRKKQPVLKDVSFSLEPGQVLCMLGPNGTGKSTLIQCLLGLQRPQGGSIVLDGRDISRLSARAKARLMAYVPQASNLAFSYEVREVVLMGRVAHLRLGIAHTQSDQDTVSSALERLHILHLQNRRLQELSGGEKQMVLVARAMVQQADYLIMDEPTANLDYSNQIRILGVIRELAKQGYGILMTTHSPDHAFLTSSRALLMRDGLVMAEGVPDGTVTTESLTGLYDTPVVVSEAEAAGERVKVCIPLLDRPSDTAI